MRALITVTVLATVGLAAPARAQQPPPSGAELAQSARGLAESAKALSDSVRETMRLDHSEKKDW